MRVLYNRVIEWENDPEVAEHQTTFPTTFTTNTSELDPHTEDEAVEAFTRLIHWMMDRGKDPRFSTRRIAARVLAIAWVLKPELCGCKSIRQLSRLTQGRVSKTDIDRIARQFVRVFGYRRVVLRARIAQRGATAGPRGAESEGRGRRPTPRG